MFAKLLKNRNTRLILISIVLGLVAALLVRSYVTNAVFERTGGKVVAVVVAADDIPAGSEIQTEQLRVATIPAAYVQQRSVAAANLSFLVGQKSAVDVSKGEGILWTDISLAPDETLEDRVRLNQRAVTIRVDQTASLDGMIQPGNRVDILCHVRLGKTGGVMHMVAQNMTIIAVGNRLTANNPMTVAGKKPETDTNNVSSVTFRASPQEAMLLSYAETQGRIVLLLRNDKDVVAEPEKDVGVTELEGPQATTTSPTQVPSAQASPSEYPTINEPGQDPRPGYLPGESDLLNELKQLKPEDAQKRLLQELQTPSPSAQP